MTSDEHRRPRYRGLGGVENSFFRVASSTRRGPDDLVSHATTTQEATAQFHTLSEENGAVDETYISLPVVFEPPQKARELDVAEAVYQAGLASSRPMRAANEEFFRIKQYIIDKTLEQMHAMSVTGQYFKPPNNETDGFLAGVVRLYVECTVRLWRLNRDAENRMRFTRAVQDYMHMLTAVEAFLLAELLKSHDSENPQSYTLRRSEAFKVRNTFRVFIQQMPMYDKWYHWGLQVSKNRMFEFLSQLPVVSIFASFPPSENQVNSLSLALNSILRNPLEGTMMGRRISGHRVALVTDNPDTKAMNLSPEQWGFETANRQQHGTYIGRRKTNAFRIEHRLPIDESIVRTFQRSPAETLLNNGVETVLSVFNKHWRNMLFQENGNFGHERQELLNPIHTLRFHIPVVLVSLTNLRGRSNFDREMIGPLIRRLEGFDPGAVSAVRRTDAERGDRATSDIAKTCAVARNLVQSVLAHVVPVCAEIPLRVAAFKSWLEAILASINQLESEAHSVRQLMLSVDKGIRLGYQLIRVTNWNIPDDSDLELAIAAYLNPAEGVAPGGVDPNCIENVLKRLSPRDSRTLQDLLRLGYTKNKAVQLLIKRSRTLLHRELRRKAIDQRISQLSYGEPVFPINLIRNDWYYVQSDSATGVFKYKGEQGGRLRFKDLVVGNSILIDRGGSLNIRQYVPVAESISRAQKAYMTLELEHLKRFSYDAFMEFGSCTVDTSLRSQLRRLAAMAQLHSYTIDNSRRTVLSEFQRKQDETVVSMTRCPPQNLIVIGGGPAGLITSIHSIQSCLMSGGKVSLYESRDTYKKDAAAFERAQVVRLDAGWIALLRFHLGTSFEDTFVPLRGETDAHLGNTVPVQGLVETTIKRLETILHEEAERLRSRGLMNYFTGSGIEFDVESGSFSKKGSTLKAGDNIRINDERWRVVGHLYPRPLRKEDVQLNHEYDILFPRELLIGSYRLVELDLAHFDFSGFVATEGNPAGLPSILQGPFDQFQVFPKGSAQIDPLGISVRRVDSPEQSMIKYDVAKEQKFQLDVNDSHVLIAAGKPSNTDEHFSVTTSEPYGVCCIEGLKVSMLMHTFGEKRFEGFADDLRSQREQNTRLVGDPIKSVALPPIIKGMATRLGILPPPERSFCDRGPPPERTLWTRYIEKTIADEGVNYNGMIESLNRFFTDLVIRAERTEDIVNSRLTYKRPDGRQSIPPSRLGFQRQRLQCRYFEVGDSYYLGMELPREFETWKHSSIDRVFPGPQYQRLREKLRSVYDRLWFEATIMVVNDGDVFNPDGRAVIPKFYLVNSLKHDDLRKMEVGEAFTLASPDRSRFRIVARDGSMVHMNAPNGATFVLPSRAKVKGQDEAIRTVGEEGMEMVEPIDVFELLSKSSSRGMSLVRTSEGYVCELPESLPVWRQSDLSRSSDGMSESSISCFTFPVSLKVNIRTMRILRAEGNDGYVTGFIGDAQASHHFMRYSALTGAYVNAVSFNNFVAQAVAGISFADRVRRYAMETNWSNGEVVERGTGHGFGEDGFCRPAFSYKSLVDYIFSRVNEHYILDEDLDSVLTHDWKHKISAGLVPRGLEADLIFREALKSQLMKVVREKFIDRAEEILDVESLSVQALASIDMAMEIIARKFKGGIAETVVLNNAFERLDPYTSDVLQTISVVIQGTVEALKQSVDYSYGLRLKNDRVSSELFHQPKPVDSFIDDYAIEAQMFANGLTQSVAFAAGSVALGLLGSNDETDVSRIFSIFLSALNIPTSFGTMANVSRYRNRNEEARVIFFDEKLPRIMKGVFSLMSVERRRDPLTPNPFVEELEGRVESFYEKAKYYDHPDGALAEFRRDYQDLISTILSDTSVVHFVKKLVKYYIADKFQANPYLQDELVEMYKILNEMIHLMRGGASRGMVRGAHELYHELLEFRPKLERSLQRGSIEFGFLKRRPVLQWSIFVSGRYFLSGVGLWRTTNTETRKVLKKLEHVSSNAEGVFLRRELRDFQELYYAGKESEITSLLFSSSTVVFYASFIFTVFRCIAVIASYLSNDDEAEEWKWAEILLEIAGFASIFSIVGATLATFHQWRKIWILSKLNVRLGQGRKAEGGLRLVRFLTRAEQLLSLCRILITICAAVSLIWSLILRFTDPGPDDDEDPDETVMEYEGNLKPVWISLFAVFMGLVTVVSYFFVELSVRYGLDPNLGPLVLEPFLEDIQKLKQKFVDPRAGGVGIETRQNIEREIWEYTAREFIHQFRFDTVFSSERFGSVFQYLQGGCPRR